MAFSKQSKHVLQHGAANFFANFVWEDFTEQGEKVSVLAMGKSSIANHRDDANAQVKLHGHMMYTKAKKGNQIYINYGKDYRSCPSTRATPARTRTERRP